MAADDDSDCSPMALVKTTPCPGDIVAAWPALPFAQGKAFRAAVVASAPQFYNSGDGKCELSWSRFSHQMLHGPGAGLGASSQGEHNSSPDGFLEYHVMADGPVSPVCGIPSRHLSLHRRQHGPLDVYNDIVDSL